MATRTISDAGGLWSATTSWVEGAVPTNADDVVATATSGALTIGAAAVCRSINLSAYTSTLTHNAFTLTVGNGTTADFNFTGSWTYSPLSTALISFSSGTNPTNLTFGGKTFCGITLNSGGNTVVYVFQDDLILLSNVTLTLTRGSLDTNNKNITGGRFLDLAGSYARTITLGSSTITTSYQYGNVILISGSNITFPVNTATFILNGTESGFNGGGLTYGGSVTFNGSGLKQVLGANTIANLTVNGVASKVDAITIDANQTITGTLTLTGNSAINRLLVQTDTLGTQRTITAANVSVTNCDFTSIVGAGASGWDISAGINGDCTNNSGITFTTPTTQHWIDPNGGNYSDSGNWTSRIPLPQDTCVFDCAFGTSKTISIDMPRVGGIDFTGATWTTALTVTPSAAISVYGSITLKTGLTWNCNQYLTLAGSGNRTITFAGLELCSTYIYMSSLGGTYTLLDNNLATVSNSRWFNLYAGTLDIQSTTFRTSLFRTNATTLAKAIKSNADGLFWFNLADYGSCDLTGCATVDFLGTFRQTFVGANGAGLNFAGKGLPNGTLELVASASSDGRTSPVISGDNTFKELKIDTTVYAKTVLFNSGSTQIVKTFTSNASSGKTLTLGKSGTHKPVLHYAGNAPIRTDYISTSNINFSPIQTWFTGANYTDGGGNLNIGFNTDFPSAPAVTQYYPVKREWTNKPPIGTPLNLNHPLAQGLRACWVFNEGGGKTIFNMVTGLGKTLPAPSSFTQEGLTTTSGLTSLGVTAAGMTMSSVVSGFVCKTIGGYSPIIDNISTARSLALTTPIGGNKLSYYVNTGASVGTLGTTALTTNRRYVGAGTHDGVNVCVYLDGKLDGTPVAKAAGAYQYAANEFFTSGAGNTFELNFLYLYTRGLDPSEIVSLSANPWQIFEPEVSWIEAAAAAYGYKPIKVTRTSKPPMGTPIDMSNPLAQGLIGAWPFNEGGGGRAFDSLNYNNGNAVNTVSTPNGLAFNGSSSYVDIATLTQSLTAFSVVTSIKTTATGLPQNIIAKDSPASRGWVLRVAGAFQLQVEINGVSLATDSVYCLLQNTQTAIAMTRSSNSGKVYVNGKQAITDAYTANSNSAAVQIGRRDYTGYYEHFQGGIDYTFLYDRTLLPEEVATLSENPWQLYEPEIMWQRTGEAPIPTGLRFYMNIGGVVKEVTGAYCLIDGVVRPITNAYGLIDGVVKSF